MAKAKKSKGFLSRAASLLGSIPAVGNVRNAAKKVGKAKKTLKKTVKKATKTAKRVVKSTKKNVKKSVKKKKKTAAKLKKGLKKAKKKAKRKVKKKLRKKVGKVFTKARKLKNNLSKNKRVKKLKKQMKKTVLKAKKSVKKVKSTAKKVSKSVVQNSKKLSKKVALGARAVNEFVKNGFNGRETASAIADFIPIVGNVKGAYEATFGKDPITGRKLGKVERAAAGAAVIGGPLVKGGTRGVKVVSGIVSSGKKSSGKVPVGKGKDAAGSLYNRSSFRKGTRTKAESEAPKNASRKMICPTCGKDILDSMIINTKNGPVKRIGYDLDHYPDTWAERVTSMKKGEVKPTRKEVLDEYNKRVRVQCHKCNISHKFEGVEGTYKGVKKDD